MLSGNSPMCCANCRIASNICSSTSIRTPIMRNICVVGDPDQSIYAWRGADIKNILDFEKDYPDAKVVRLEQNYRSTKTILRIASELISHNIHRKEKSLWTENDNGEPASVFLCQDEHDEAAIVTRQLREIHDNCNVEW